MLHGIKNLMLIHVLATWLYKKATGWVAATPLLNRMEVFHPRVFIEYPIERESCCLLLDYFVDGFDLLVSHCVDVTDDALEGVLHGTDLVVGETGCLSVPEFDEVSGRNSPAYLQTLGPVGRRYFRPCTVLEFVRHLCGVLFEIEDDCFVHDYNSFHILSLSIRYSIIKVHSLI